MKRRRVEVAAGDLLLLIGTMKGLFLARPHVNIFVGDESIRSWGGLDAPLPADAPLSIIPAVSGGR